MLCLNIRTKQAAVGMNTQQGKMDMKSPLAEVDLDQTMPHSGVAPGEVRIDIDQYPCRRAYGYRTNGDSLREFAQKGLQDVNAGVARRAREGTDFLKNGARSNVVASQAKAKILQRKNTQVTFTMVPAPNITVNQGKLKGKTEPGTVDIKIKPSPVQLDYMPAQLNIYLAQEASIRAWITEGKYDIYA